MYQKIVEDLQWILKEISIGINIFSNIALNDLRLNSHKKINLVQKHKHCQLRQKKPVRQ